MDINKKLEEQNERRQETARALFKLEHKKSLVKFLLLFMDMNVTDPVKVL